MVANVWPERQYRCYCSDYYKRSQIRKDTHGAFGDENWQKFNSTFAPGSDYDIYFAPEG